MLTKLRTRRDEAGFTLVELLIVIAILGVLAGVVVFSVAGVNDTSQKSACQTEASVVRTAEEANYAAITPHAYAASTVLVTNKLLVSDPKLVTVVSTGTAYTLTWTGGVTGTCGSISGITAP